MGFARKRVGKDGKPRYTATYVDLRGSIRAEPEHRVVEAGLESIDHREDRNEHEGSGQEQDLPEPR